MELGLMLKFHYTSVCCGFVVRTKTCCTTDQPAIERVQALADIWRSAPYAFAVYKKAISLHTWVVIATKPVRRPTVHS